MCAFEQCISEGKALTQRSGRGQGGSVGNVFRADILPVQPSQVTYLFSIKGWSLLCEFGGSGWAVLI